MSEDKRPTVRDIEWHAKSDLSGDYVFAEDEYLFTAQQYSQQVCEEHNEVQALRKALSALTETEALNYNIGADERECCYCGVFTRFDRHEDDCPWLAAKQLLEPPAQSGHTPEEV